MSDFETSPLQLQKKYSNGYISAEKLEMFYGSLTSAPSFSDLVVRKFEYSLKIQGKFSSKIRQTI